MPEQLSTVKICTYNQNVQNDICYTNLLYYSKLVWGGAFMIIYGFEAIIETIIQNFLF